jgi:hypothetical protein
VLNNALTGLTSTPTVYVDQPPVGVQAATATANLSGGVVTSVTVTDGGSGYDPENPPSVYLTTEAVESIQVGAQTDLSGVQGQISELGDLLDSVGSQVTAFGSSTPLPSGTRDGQVQLKDTLLHQFGSNEFLYYDRPTQSLYTSNLVASSNVTASSTVRAQSVVASGSLTAQTGNTVTLTASTATIANLNASSITLSGSGTGGSSSAAPTGYGFFVTNNSPGSSTVSSTVGNPFSNQIVITFDTTIQNTTSGNVYLSGSAVRLKPGGVYFVTGCGEWSNWSSGYRLAYLSVQQYGGANSIRPPTVTSNHSGLSGSGGGTSAVPDCAASNQHKG